MFELNDEVWGIDPVVNKFHHCRGKVVAIHTAAQGHPVYLVEFDDLGTAIMNQDQLTKNINYLHD